MLTLKFWPIGDVGGRGMALLTRMHSGNLPAPTLYVDGRTVVSHDPHALVDVLQPMLGLMWGKCKLYAKNTTTKYSGPLYPEA